MKRRRTTYTPWSAKAAAGRLPLLFTLRIMSPCLVDKQASIWPGAQALERCCLGELLVPALWRGLLVKHCQALSSIVMHRRGVESRPKSAQDIHLQQAMRLACSSLTARAGMAWHLAGLVVLNRPQNRPSASTREPGSRLGCGAPSRQADDSTGDRIDAWCRRP